MTAAGWDLTAKSEAGAIELASEVDLFTTVASPCWMMYAFVIVRTVYRHSADCRL